MPKYVPLAAYVWLPLTTLLLIVPLDVAVLSPQSIVAAVAPVHDAGLSTAPENGTVACAVIVSLFASATGAAISATATRTPTSPAMRRIKQPHSPVILRTPR